MAITLSCAFQSPEPRLIEGYVRVLESGTSVGAELTAGTVELRLDSHILQTISLDRRSATTEGNWHVLFLQPPAVKSTRIRVSVIVRGSTVTNEYPVDVDWKAEGNDLPLEGT